MTEFLKKCDVYLYQNFKKYTETDMQRAGFAMAVVWVGSALSALAIGGGATTLWGILTVFLGVVATIGWILLGESC